MPTLSEIAASIYRGTFGEEPNGAQVRALGTWVRQERGTPLSGGIFANNPLNVTLTPAEAAGPFKTSWVPNGAGGADSAVRAFPSLVDGIAASSRRLLDSAYSNIRATLKALGNGGNEGQFFSALRASPWAGNRYAGADLPGLFSSVDLTLPWEEGGVLPPADGPSGTWNVGNAIPGGGTTGSATSGLQPPPGGTSYGGSGAAKEGESLLDYLRRLLSNVAKALTDPTTWRRVGLVLLATALLIAGFLLYVKGWVPSLPGLPAVTIGGK